MKLGDARLPDGLRVYAIGDVHGCVDEMNEMLTLIDDDFRANPTEEFRVIFIGDYTDRGPDTKAVIDRLMELQQVNKNVTCLLGNHDEKLILACKPANETWVELFLRYGGAETLKSYGMDDEIFRDLAINPFTEKAAKQFARRCHRAVGENHLTYLNWLPRSIVIGDYFFCHAGVHPDKPFDNQDEHDLIWIREPFLSHKEHLEKVVVHGHTPQEKPEAKPHRINVDTGCVYGNALTAAVLEENKHRFLQVKPAQTYWKRETNKFG